jgi:hypothetical protein
MTSCNYQQRLVFFAKILITSCSRFSLVHCHESQDEVGRIHEQVTAHSIRDGAPRSAGTRGIELAMHPLLILLPPVSSQHCRVQGQALHTVEQHRELARSPIVASPTPKLSWMYWRG